MYSRHQNYSPDSFIRLTVTELAKCIFVNFSISSGYYSEEKGLLLLATDATQEVLFFYPLNDMPKGHISRVVSQKAYKDFFVCGTKRSTYAVDFGVYLSVAVFLLILLIVSRETIPRCTTTDNIKLPVKLKREQKSKVLSSSSAGDHDLKATTTTTAQSGSAKAKVEIVDKTTPLDNHTEVSEMLPVK